jgi:ABC-type uncharacterized transport system substrate-binding protein
MHKTLLKLFLNSCSDNRKSKTCPEPRRRIENLKWVGLSVIAFVLVVTGAVAQAQQPKKVPRLGYLSNRDPASESARSEAILLALRELGYIEGQNIAIEYRYAEAKLDRLPALAAELVRLKVDIIVTGGDQPIQAAKNATKTIPIVMMGQGIDPVKAGFVESLARPGGNITGLTILFTELAGKRLELFKEAVPKVARVAALSVRSSCSGQCTRVKRESPSRGARAGVDYSALGGTRCGRFREGIRGTKQGAPGWTLRVPGRANE